MPLSLSNTVKPEYTVPKKNLFIHKLIYQYNSLSSVSLIFDHTLYLSCARVYPKGSDVFSPDHHGPVWDLEGGAEEGLSRHRNGLNTVSIVLIQGAIQGGDQFLTHTILVDLMKCKRER